MAENIEQETQDHGTHAVENLLHMLDLSPQGNNQHEDIFKAVTLNKESPRIYGGQVLAQSIMAMAATVDPHRTLHSIHGYFLRPGSINEELSYGVQHLNNARSFSSRRVQAYQQSQAIFSAIASFQTPAEGPEYASAMPADLPAPQTLPSAADLIGHLKVPLAQKVAFGRPFDVRHISTPIYVAPDSSAHPTNAVWFKTFTPLPNTPVLHQAAIAYASDYTQLEPALRAHRLSWLEPGMKVASLDHAIWFHRPARADQWLLLTQESPSTQQARGLSVGKIFTQDGTHVATVTQEAMLRLPEYR